MLVFCSHRSTGMQQLDCLHQVVGFLLITLQLLALVPSYQRSHQQIKDHQTCRGIQLPGYRLLFNGVFKLSDQ
jgi:hypothetical protein